MTYTQTPPVAPTMAGTTTIVYAAVPAGGLAVLPGSILLIKNGSGSPITVTINVAALKKYKGYTITSPTVSVAAGAEVPLGPIPGELHQIVNPADANNGYALIDFSSITSVTAAVINVPQ